MTTEATPLILSRREGAITHITLNRPRAINALNLEMFRGLGEALSEANASETAAIYLDGAGDRGFCGGGDVKEISSQDSTHILATEYRVDHDVATSPVPVVAIMDGITMGGGIGLGGHAAVRIVTERSRLAMPEVRIGIMPDVGGHLLLARGPGRLGELLAITAGEMTAGDAIALGFADAFIPSDRLPELQSKLSEGESVSDAVEALQEPAPDAPILQSRRWWDPLADDALGDSTANDPADCLDRVQRLLNSLEADGGAEAKQVLTTVRGMCPMSVAVTIGQIGRTRAHNLDLADVLRDDLRVLGRLAPRPDFAEGVRAQIVDKDRSPSWNPDRIEDVDPMEFAAILAPHRAGEPELAL